MENLLVPAALLLVLGVVIHVVYAAVQGEDFGRNHAIGIRTRATLSSDQAWQAGHHAAAPWLLGAATAAYVGAVACGALAVVTDGRVDDVVVGVVPGTAFLAVLLLLLLAGRVANRAAHTAVVDAR